MWAASAGSLSESDFCRFCVRVNPASLESLSESDSNLRFSAGLLFPEAVRFAFRAGDILSESDFRLRFVPFIFF